ncbi:MAG: glycosyltransferase [Chloroflexota bacterium]|nr:glycosyltransferase [Chloroflexota bacterium]
MTTYGTGGDFAPFAALGLGLRDRGHEVLFAVEDPFLPTVRTLGFASQRIPGNSKEAIAGHHEELFNARNPLQPLRILLEKDVLPSLRGKVQGLLEVCQGTDVLLSAAFAPAAGIVAEITGVRWASVPLHPLSVPSRHLEMYPLPSTLPGPLRWFANRAMLALGQIKLRQIVDEPVNRIRAGYGLPPRRDLLGSGGTSKQLTAVATSPAFVPRPPDWPEHAKLTGFLFWDMVGLQVEGAEHRITEEIATFLDAPGDVVAVSSGSMAPWVGDAFTRFYRTSVAAIRRAGARALVVGAAPGVLPEQVPEGVLSVPFAPFGQVYPRCSAVLHHGGIGTTAQGLRAGVPALVVPWGFDQFFNGARIERIGAGRWMGRKYYTVERATEAVRSLLEESGYRRRARAIGAELTQEDGLEALCKEVEELACRPLGKGLPALTGSQTLITLPPRWRHDLGYPGGNPPSAAGSTL